MRLTYREEAALDGEAILSYGAVIQQQPERADRFLSAFLQAVERSAWIVSGMESRKLGRN